MEILTDILVRKTSHSKIKEVDFDNLEFGKYVSDHMLVCDFHHGQWHQPLITPFANLSLSPTALGLHYGQTVFEGMKAFRMTDGRTNIFRIDRHHDRLSKSLFRMCMPAVPEEIFREGLEQLVTLDRDWIPHREDSALYIRPFMFASEARFGVKISDEYRFIIFTGPVPTLYKKPIKVKVETEYTRAAKGGTGAAKCGGNYGGAYYPTKLAREAGYDQVLWTDAKENKYIEESGVMNVLFVIGDTLVTGPLSDTILDGITRECLLVLSREMGYKVEERPVSIHELEQAFRNNTITDAFGAGTAAVVAPIGTIHINGTDYHLPGNGPGVLSQQLRKKMEMIRTGREADLYGWNYII
jgi:branched-chain amino acid aminotransferase